MKKNIFYIFIILALVFGFSFFVGTQKTEAADLYYFLMYTKTQSSSGVKAPVPSVEFSECNKTRTEFMNSAPYLQSKNSNFKEGVYVGIPSFCIKETNPFNPEPGEVQNVEGQKDKPKDDTYTLLAPLGKLTTAPKNIGDYFNVIFNLAIGLCAVLAVIMIVLGGVQYMGDESIFGKTEAKSKIFSAILGLIIALGSYALLNTINPDLLGKKGVTIKTVSAAIVNLPDVGDSSIDPGFETGTGSYSTNTPISPGVTSVINKTKEGWIIDGFLVSTNNKKLTIFIKKGSEIKDYDINISIGVNGYSEIGQGVEGDKKTPKGTWKILTIKTMGEGKPIYSQSGSNMGASFWLISPTTNGERGIGFHGNKSGTLGVTNGCIRLTNADLLGLLPYIKTGTKVVIS